ncbi:EF_hand domain-containing protein [Hexamita inflata]|uniref:EF hand domain-containing protein n=1 Tax=Hexamita inflata TaxID=28002 RepID=A0AA86NFS0_9EUKA|nr:EF hand domain-containing protein [Hexamita inflata]
MDNDVFQREQQIDKTEAKANEKKQAAMIKRYNELFNRVDVDGSNHIELDEVKKMFKDEGYNLTDEQVEKIYRLIDSNGDGKLSRPEFTRIIYVLDNSQPEDAQKIEFLIADVDYSGELDMNEVAVVLQRLGVEKTTEEIADVFEKLTGNREGPLDLVQYDQFVAELNLQKFEAGDYAFKQSTGIAKKQDEPEEEYIPQPGSGVVFEPQEEVDKTEAELNEKKQAALIKRYTELFNSIDVDHSNSIELKELIAFFKKEGYNLTDEQVQSVYRIIDNNGDGSLSRPEFTRMLYVLDNSSPTDTNKIQFLIADTDYSGELDVNEVAVALEKLGQHKTAKQIENAIQKVTGNEGQKTLPLTFFDQFYTEIGLHVQSENYTFAQAGEKLKPKALGVRQVYTGEKLLARYSDATLSGLKSIFNEQLVEKASQRTGGQDLNKMLYILDNSTIEEKERFEFVAADGDCDGAVTANEMMTVLDKIGQPKKQHEVEAVYFLITRKKQGPLTLEQFEKFLSMMGDKK